MALIRNLLNEGVMSTTAAIKPAAVVTAAASQPTATWQTLADGSSMYGKLSELLPRLQQYGSGTGGLGDISTALKQFLPTIGMSYESMYTAGNAGNAEHGTASTDAQINPALLAQMDQQGYTFGRERDAAGNAFWNVQRNGQQVARYQTASPDPMMKVMRTAVPLLAGGVMLGGATGMLGGAGGGATAAGTAAPSMDAAIAAAGSATTPASVAGAGTAAGAGGFSGILESIKAAGGNMLSWAQANPKMALQLAGMIGSGVAGASAGKAPTANIGGTNVLGSGAGTGTGGAGGTSAVPTLQQLLANAPGSGGYSGLRDAENMAGQIGATTWGDYNSRVRPVEERYFADALTAGDQAAQDSRAGMAAADMQRSAEAQFAARDRNLRSMGINPGGTAGQSRADSVRLAAARVGAANAAREAERARGDTMRANAVQLGGAKVGQALTAGGQQGNLSMARQGIDMDAWKANQNATQQNNSNAMDTWRAGLAERQFSTQTDLANKGLLLDQARINAGITAQNNQSKADTWSGIGSAIKWGVDNWDTLGSIFSDPAMKDIGPEADPEKDLRAVRRMRNSKFSYRPDTGLTTMAQQGVMADEFQRETGMGDGHTIPVAAALGVTMNAVKALDKKVSRKTARSRA